MILLNGPNTPFGRMALVTALELGVSVENRVIAVASADWLDAHNPLRQIPTLILDDESAIFDSRVICTFFAGLKPEKVFVPSDVGVQTRWAMILGLMEAGVSRQMERIRPPGEQSPGVIAVLERRIARTIARMEEDADALCADFGRIDRIAGAVALAYIDFRYPHDWRSTAPRLARWAEGVDSRPAMCATPPR